MKYHNKITVIDNIKFQSKKEAEYYLYLKNELRLGKITDLRLQVKYELQPKIKINGKTIREINYIADFVYNKDDEEVVIDCKGFRTPVYKLKAKMFAYKYKKEIRGV